MDKGVWSPEGGRRSQGDASNSHAALCVEAAGLPYGHTCFSENCSVKGLLLGVSLQMALPSMWPRSLLCVRQAALGTSRGR